MLTRLLFILLILSVPTQLCSQTQITGRVIDTSTTLALPYATIAHVNSLSGTTSDAQGEFNLQVVALTSEDTIEVSYIGYRSVKWSIENFSEPLIIALEPMASLLEAVIVRPLEAQEYLCVVQRKLNANTTPYSFNTISHYEEKMQEGDKTIDHHEGMFKSWHDSYRKGAETEHQLGLYRHEDWEELAFMRKKAEKGKKKYLKENPDKEDEFEEGKLFVTDFGGPEGIQKLNLYARSLYVLDSTQHKHFEFNYVSDSEYMGAKLTVISYRSRGKVDDRKFAGTIYIDRDSDAVVWVKEEGTLMIPLIARPILFALGISIKSIGYKMEMKLRPIEGLWYPQFSHWDVTIDVKKKYLFDKNEEARFKIKQELEISEIHTSGVINIPVSKRFDSKKKMEDQVFPVAGLNW